MDSEAVLWAVKNGDIESLKEKTKDIPDINQKFKYDRTLMHYAADYGQTDVCKYLIEHGANPNLADKYGVTPLLAAIYEDHIDCAGVLLNKGAKMGQAPDGRSYMENAQSENMKKLLGSQTADINS
ncbi:unnamed protein product [Calicophoron daubneyi]|uniref:Myotrophin n=1 Tax=Calicophoron daubneyi TaxID=300641 RepID=A0AAV2TQR1_CALDB